MPLILLKRIHSEDGAAAVPFILVLPLFWTVLAIVVQYGLMVAGYTTLGGAAEAAGRAAVVCLPDGNTQNDPGAIKRAACMVLAPLSPQASTVDPEGDAIYRAFNDVAMQPSPTYAARYTFAMQSANVSWNPQLDFTTRSGCTVTVTVQYSFKLTVPVAATLLARNITTIAGVPGRYTTLARQVTVFTAPSRKAWATDTGGAPLQQ